MFPPPHGRAYYTAPTPYAAKGLFTTSKPYAPAEKWQEIASFLGVTSDDLTVSQGMAEATNNLITGALESLQDYLDMNFPEYRQRGDHTAYDLFFPVISELAIACGLVGLDEKPQAEPRPSMDVMHAAVIKSYQEDIAENERTIARLRQELNAN